MTDERIKELEDKGSDWAYEIVTRIHVATNGKVNRDVLPFADIAGKLGFLKESAERLSKIEELEYLRDKSEYKMNPEMYCFFSKRIDELKEEGE